MRPAPGSGLDLRPTRLDAPDAIALVERLGAYYVAIYGGGDATSMDAVQFVPPSGLFVVGYIGHTPVACGGWRARDGEDGRPDPVLRPGDAELKRLYVDPAHRGRGVGRLVLAHLEESAAAAGRRRMVLETGTRQPEALALYARTGYAPIEGFGMYRCEPGSRCFARDLPVPPATAGGSARPGE